MTPDFCIRGSGTDTEGFVYETLGVSEILLTDFF
jgi:hypothetical protein